MMKFGADYHSNIVCLTERFLWWKQCSLPGCGRISSYYLCQRGYVFARVCLLVGWLVCQHAYIITVEWMEPWMEDSHLQLVSGFVFTSHVHLEPDSVSCC